MYQIIIKIYFKVLKIYWNIFVKLHLKLLGVKVGKNVKFLGFPVVNLGKNSEIVLGDNSVFISDSRFTALGVNHPVVLKTSANAKLFIGNDTGVSGATIYASKKITIGEMCLIGADVKIFDTNFHALIPENRRYNSNFNDIKSKEINIEDNCFIGTNTVILIGSHIKKDSVIQACSSIKEIK